MYGAVYAPIDNMQLNYEGVVKEHPDLEGKKDWNQQAIKRFKEKIKSFENENDTAKYIIKELKGVGYEPKYKQKQDFRREVIS